MAASLPRAGGFAFCGTVRWGFSLNGLLRTERCSRSGSSWKNGEAKRPEIAIECEDLKDTFPKHHGCAQCVVEAQRYIAVFSQQPFCLHFIAVSEAEQRKFWSPEI